MADSSHGSALPYQIRNDAQIRDHTFTDARVSVRAGARRSGRSGGVFPARFGRADAAGLVAPCSGSVSARLRKIRASEARRAWIERQGEADPATPVWLSRAGWIDEVRAWVASPDFAAVRAVVGVSITSATVVSIAVLWAGFADHSTGRNAAVTRARIAEQMGCAVKTVSRAWQVLGAAGLAVEAARGHGSNTGHPAGNRPSIWHLVSRRPAAPAAADSGGNVPLPPKAGSCCLTHVGSYSPSVRERAREDISSTKQPHQPRSRRRWRATPRPLPVQRLAAGLVTPVPVPGEHTDGRRTALIAGLERGHIGAICDAITGAGIDAAAWTPKALVSALDADMKARGWSWPDRVEHPGAFLAVRLRRLPARPDSTPIHGGTAAGLDEDRTGLVEPLTERVTPVEFTATQRARIAAAQEYARQELTERRARRSAESAHHRLPAERVRQGAPLEVPETGPCATCACEDAPRRRFLPAHRSHVCDGCWDTALSQEGA